MNNSEAGEDAGKHQRTADSLDWQAFRLMSIQPHGFREKRLQIWPKLLHVDGQKFEYDSTDASSEWSEFLERPGGEEEILDGDPHSDERQIELDTDRSFVLYPVDGISKRDKLQAALNRLIVSIFRRRPYLHYFQGYHDIVSVIFLTLPRELHFPVAEKLSLHRLRDSMGTNLDAVIGTLRILQRILRLADRRYAATLERTASLPYYALSNLLTLFSHDVPTLSLIQHVFDYLLCRPPIAAVYLAAALILTRREEVQVLEDEGEEGMMHSLLTVLPDLYEEGDEPPEDLQEPPSVPGESSVKLAATSPHTPMSSSSTQTEFTAQAETSPLGTRPPPGEQYENALAERIPELPEQAAVYPGHSMKTEEVRTGAPLKPAPARDSTHGALGSSRSYGHAPEGPILVVPKLTAADRNGLAADKLPLETPKAEAIEPDVSVKTEPPGEAPLPPPSDHGVEGDKAEQDEKEKARTSTPEPFPRPHRPRISLTSLLTQADELYVRFPPTHPDVALPSVMGPQSVVFTWSERAADLPDDNEAERMVMHPELIVLPHVDDADDEESHGKSRRSGKEEQEKRRRRLRKPRRLTDMVVQRKTMVAGAVLALGVAMAVYGLNGGLPGGGGHNRSGFGKELKKFGKFLGSVFTGA